MIMFITVTNEFKHEKQKEKGLTITFVKPLVLVGGPEPNRFAQRFRLLYIICDEATSYVFLILS